LLLALRRHPARAPAQWLAGLGTVVLIAVAWMVALTRT
jgi:hypothetical protein